MWIVIQEMLPFLLAVLFITQVVYPIITDEKLFWLFRGKKKIINENTLSEEYIVAEKAAKIAKDKVNNIKVKAEDKLKEANSFKEKSDNLL